MYAITINTISLMIFFIRSSFLMKFRGNPNEQKYYILKQIKNQHKWQNCFIKSAQFLEAKCKYSLKSIWLFPLGESEIERTTIKGTLFK